MRKTPFIIGIFCFYGATAQQNEFFDIQKHLEKKNKKGIQLQIQKPAQVFSSIKVRFNTFIPSMKQAILSHSLPNNSKVYLLPMDNMLCVVPDMDQFNMPNAASPEKYNESLLGKFKEPGRFSNMQIPYKMIPE